jgi:hypothetical protein
MNDYVLMLRRDPSVQLTPQQGEELMKRFVAWSNGLKDSGALKGVERLKAAGEGRTVRQRGGAIAVDGPYTESKEAIAGFYLIQAPSLDAAVAIARECPVVTIGGSVEVRETDAFPVKPKA